MQQAQVRRALGQLDTVVGIAAQVMRTGIDPVQPDQAGPAVRPGQALAALGAPGGLFGHECGLARGGLLRQAQLLGIVGRLATGGQCQHQPGQAKVDPTGAGKGLHH
jgi:hypothetical protein